MPSSQSRSPKLDRSPSQLKKNSETHIGRPPNAFMLFRAWFVASQRVPANVERDPRKLSSIIGVVWENLPQDERQTWYAKANIAKEEHRRKHPDYTFKP
ncbi:uncharacterized protein C8R40DRAFT_1062906, partial [Lentinula edodes]|uniref:uncharacterized protein n=1 Tax=Lentinula edodes TaxID=5353 RepID=UPI001E8E3077